MSHPTAFVLERLAVDDLPPDEAAAARAHVAACAECCAYADSLAARSAARLAEVPPAAFVQKLVARRRVARRRVAAAVTTGMGALLAASLILWLPRAGVRLKGGGFALERQRDGVVTRVGSDAAVRAGDRLRVIVTLPAPAPADAWFVGVDGHVDALVDAPVMTAAGEQPLPGSVTVDAPCVDGWIVVASGDAASPATEASLRAHAAGGVDRARAAPPGLPAHARAARLRCE